jgi:hypothetical protein
MACLALSDAQNVRGAFELLAYLRGNAGDAALTLLVGRHHEAGDTGIMVTVH